MAVAQLSDVEGFVEIVRSYRLGAEGLAWFLAVALMGAEAISGACLLLSAPRAQLLGAGAALGVALAWSTLAVIAYLRGIALANCGCFGVHVGQPLRWWTLLEDLWFIALALFVLRSLLRDVPLRHASPRDDDA